MSSWLSIAVATAAGVAALAAIVAFVVRPLSRRLPWRVEERPRPQGLVIELRRPGRPARVVAVVPPDAPEQRRLALLRADELRRRLNAGERVDPAEGQAGSTSAV